MTTLATRNKLHELIDTLEEEKVNAIYTLLKPRPILEGFEEERVEYTAEFKAELERRYDEYVKDPSTAFSPEEVERRIHEKLNKKRVK